LRRDKNSFHRRIRTRSLWSYKRPNSNLSCQSSNFSTKTTRYSSMPFII